MKGTINIKDLEQMLQEKKTKRDKCVEEQVKIRKSVTDADYTPRELEEKKHALRYEGGCMLPSKIIYKLQPLQSQEYRLNTEINLLREILKKYK